MIAEVDGHKDIILTDMTQVIYKNKYIPLLFLSALGLLAAPTIYSKETRKSINFPYLKKEAINIRNSK